MLGMFSQGAEILVIVGDRQRRERIARVLADEGFSVTAVAEGLAALRVCANRRFGLIVAATDLPGSLDGPAIVQRTRRHQPSLKVLYTGEPLTRPAAGNPDFNDFIAAPFQPSELIGCVFELLHRGSAVEIADLGRRVRADRKVS